MTETNLMSYNTFTFKTEAQMLLHIRLWEEKGKLLLQSSNKKDVQDSAIIKFGIKRVLIRHQHFLNIIVHKHIRIVKKPLIIFAKHNERT